jgi:hypothetical protein
VLYLVEQPPHYDLLRLSLSTGLKIDIVIRPLLEEEVDRTGISAKLLRGIKSTVTNRPNVQSMLNGLCKTAKLLGGWFGLGSEEGRA